MRGKGEGRGSVRRWREWKELCEADAHLHRHLAVFDFRHNRRAALKISDAERAEDLLRQARNKRLTYRGLVKAVTPKQNARKILSKRRKSPRDKRD
jgi:hypothetical protein